MTSTHWFTSAKRSTLPCDFGVCKTFVTFATLKRSTVQYYIQCQWCNRTYLLYLLRSNAALSNTACSFSYYCLQSTRTLYQVAVNIASTAQPSSTCWVLYLLLAKVIIWCKYCVSCYIKNRFIIKKNMKIIFLCKD